MLLFDVCLSDVCLSRTSGLTREQRDLGRPKLAQRQPTSHVTRTPFSRSEGQRSICCPCLEQKTCQNRCHLANKYEDVVNLQGAEAYHGSRPPTACYYYYYYYYYYYFIIIIIRLLLILLLLPPSRRLCFNQRQLVSLFVCQQDYAKTTQPTFRKFVEKVAHGPRRKPSDFGGNPNHITLGVRQGYGKFRLRVKWTGQHYTRQNRVIPGDISIARYESAPIVSPGVCLTVRIE